MMNLKQLLKTFLVLGCLAFTACENDGPSLRGDPSSDGWTLDFRREDPWSNSVTIKASCQGGSPAITMPTTAGASYSLSCASGESIKIELEHSYLGSRLEEFTLDGNPVNGWDGWNAQSPNPPPLLLDDSHDGQLLKIIANELG